MLKYVMAISSARRLRLLAERSTCYVIAGADRGQVVFAVVRDCTGDVRKKPYFSGKSYPVVNSVSVQVSSMNAIDSAVCWLEHGCGAGYEGSECFRFLYRGCPRQVRALRLCTIGYSFFCR
jgi:hypothetical protein